MATVALIVVNTAAVLVHWWTAVPPTLDFTGAIWAPFYHAGLLPFCVNVSFLWLFGDNVEDQTGRGRFVLLYVLCGFAATLAQAFVDPGAQQTLIGAGGATGGVLGAYFMLYPRSRILMLVPVPLALHELPVAFFLAFWLLLQVTAVGAQAGIHARAADLAPSLAAHAVAFAIGALLCLALRRRERAHVDWWGS